LVLAAASVVLVLMISVPSVYFIFFSEKPAPLPGPESVPLVAQESGRQIEVASVTIDDQPDLMTTRQSGNIVLADFVILASHLSKEMTYVYADISIDYSDQRAYHEISNNLSFYRDLIYEAIQANLVSERQNEVTQTDLLWGVENSLKKVLPPHYIEKISFKTFRTS
jgi:pilus assembly protein FimV